MTARLARISMVLAVFAACAGPPRGDPPDPSDEPPPTEAAAPAPDSVVDAPPPPPDGPFEPPAPRDAESRTLPYAAPPLERIRRAARELLLEGDPTVWGIAGRLTEVELSNPFLTSGPDGLAAFNVADSSGYEGDYKCNLLAFELAFRAGLQVPLIGRGRGWGYPGPSLVMDEIDRGRAIEQWARRVARTDLASLRALTASGAALLIVGRGSDGRPGHVGVVDEVHRVEHDPAGRVTEVEYTGWEANLEGGRYLRRTWLPGVRSSIAFLELIDPPPGQGQVVALGFGPMTSSGAASLPDSPEDRTLGRGREMSLPVRGRGLPDLPVAHGLLGDRSRFGSVVDVRRITLPPVQSLVPPIPPE
jgi:hypothetical protein